MAVAKVIDDTAFEMNVMALQIAVFASKKPELTAIFMPLADQFRELAWTSAHKAKKIAEFFHELTSLITEDMRKTAEQKIQNAIQKGKYAAESIAGNANYIKDEIMHIVNELSSTPIASVKVRRLDDFLFKLKVISATAKLNGFPLSTLDGLSVFKETLSEALDFCRTIIEPESGPSVERRAFMALEDIAFQGNLLWFYTKGEIEAVCAEMPDVAQKATFGSIEAKVDGYIKIALGAERQDAADLSAFKEIAEKAYEIVSDLNEEADKLGVHGGGIKVLAAEHKKLADKTVECANHIESMRGK
jgi:hypothetical protein